MLAELQSAFRDALDGDSPPAGIAGDPAAAAKRFAVYRNNVARSLAEALAARFPVIERLVGADFFRALLAILHTDGDPDHQRRDSA